MKSVKAKLAKNLKSIKPNAYLKQDRVLRVLAAADGLINYIPKITYSISQTKSEPVRKQESDEEKSEKIPYGGTVQDAEIIDVPELIRDLEVEEDEEISGIYFGDKENVKPPRTSSSLGNTVADMSRKSETGNLFNFFTLPASGVPEFRRPDLNSSSLFDPNLLAAFEQAVNEYIRTREAEITARAEQRKIEKEKEEIFDEQASLETEQQKTEQQETEQEETEELEERRIQKSEPQQVYNDPLSDFAERCPPGGEGSIVFYTTSLRGIRKTFDDCNKIRFLLDNLRVQYYERDVSMHRVYRDELWRTMEGKADLPVLFIRGRYIGGAQEVLGLHEQGKFRVLLENLPVIRPDNCGCETCEGVRFVMCFNCRGSHKVRLDNGLRSECLVCNENGLIVCPFCC